MLTLDKRGICFTGYTWSFLFLIVVILSLVCHIFIYLLLFVTFVMNNAAADKNNDDSSFRILLCRHKMIFSVYCNVICRNRFIANE